MGDINKFCDRMRYWCDEGNLGYSWDHRWDIRYGGEADCSSLVIFCLNEAGFDTGSATYTGNMKSNLTARGWKVVPNDGNPQKGDILLNEAEHVAAWLGDCLAQASINEYGTVRGGQPGDQTGHETNTRSYYNYPWDFYLRYEGVQSVPPQIDSENPVKIAQKWLVDMGYSVGSYGIDGVRGKDTIAALTRCLQKTLNAYGAGLEVDGIYGEKTAAAYDEYGPVDKDCKRTCLIQITQAALLAMGYSVGDYGIDGVCGNDTDSAIRLFQKQHELEVDGKAGKLTGYKLFK